jgi:ribonuclease R
LARRSGPSDKSGRAKGGGRRPRRGSDGQKAQGRRTSSSKGPRKNERATPRTRAKNVRDRVGIVREADAPSASGQHLRVEDSEGDTWQIESLGEAVETGARIVFEPVGSSDSRTGELIRVQDGVRREWVCTLHRPRGGRVELVPFGGLSMPEMRLDDRDAKGAQDGDRVVVIVKDTGKARSAQRARESRSRRRDRPGPLLNVRVVEVLGPASTPDSDHRAIVWKHRIVRDFPRRARLEADALPESIARTQIERRLDLRALPFITIDPSSARDHDDAVFAEERPRAEWGVVDAEGQTRSKRPSVSWARRLWVAIADVAHFVEAGGAIDSEARRRGNSFYFPDRAIPMLPERLSSGMCSLRPDEDRLALVVELRLVADGRVADALFHEAIIRSHARLSYEDAAAWLDSAEPEDRVWGDSLRCLDEIADQFVDARRAAGAITLELPEIKIELDDSGRPVDAIVRTRNRAHILIEEAMLAANRAVGTALDRAGRTTIHRVHPPPSPQKLVSLSLLLDRLGIAADEDLAAPGVLAGILEKVRGTSLEEALNVAALRSMSQARYEAESGGHYALRFDHYAHFTSPIRRYADLDVHRTLKRWLQHEGEPDASRDVACARLALWLSGRERVAMEVERDAEALACCAILSGREGEGFSAVVSAASEFGLFIRLDSPSASGLVPIRTMEGHWTFDPEADVLFGPKGGARLGRGDAVEVVLLEVDADRGRLAFRLEPSRRDGSKRPPRDRR